MSLLIWSLLLGGISVHVGGSEPVVLYFDLVLVCWLVYEVVWNGFFPNFSDWIVRLGAFWIFSGLVSTLVNLNDVSRGLVAIKIFGFGMLVYVLAIKAPPSVLSISLWGGVVGALLLSNYERVQYGTYDGPAGLKDEIGMIMGRSNYIASILVLLLPLAVASGFLHKGKKRWLFVGCTMLMLSGLIATMSRGAMLSITLSTVVSTPLLWKIGVRMKHLLAAMAVVGLVIVLLPNDLLGTNIKLVTYRLANPDQTREDLMKATWNTFKDHPVLGTGPGQLTGMLRRQVSLPDQNVGFMNGHNLILDALAENGIASGIALLSMVGIALRRAWLLAVKRSNALDVALWVGLLAGVMHEMVEASFEGQQFLVVFWTLVALIGSKNLVNGRINAIRTPLKLRGTERDFACIAPKPL
jgi:O-antigen ligase